MDSTIPHKPLVCEVDESGEREGERERERQTEPETDRQIDRERETETETDTKGERDRERERWRGGGRTDGDLEVICLILARPFQHEYRTGSASEPLGHGYSGRAAGGAEREDIACWPSG